MSILDEIKIDTAFIGLTADNVNLINNTIRNGETGVNSAVATLSQSWQGDGANACISYYKKIEKAYESRYSVVNQMVGFLKNMVGETYEISEGNLVSAVSAFK